MLTILKLHGCALLVDQGFKSGRDIGIPTGGAMDKLGLRLLNILLGNKVDEVGLEVTGSLSALVEAEVYLCAGPVGANVKLNDHPIGSGTVVKLMRGDRLWVGPSTSGVWTTLAFSAGFERRVWNGSKGSSMPLAECKADFRQLKVGDQLNFNRQPSVGKAIEPKSIRASLPGMGWQAEILPTVHFVAAHEFEKIGLEAGVEFIATMSPVSNRMGYRFDCSRAQWKQMPASIRSYPTQPGLIQLPPDGKPVVLMADCQTTGGYPRLGFVPDGELWKVALLKPGQSALFKQIDIQEACNINSKAVKLEARFECLRDCFSV